MPFFNQSQVFLTDKAILAFTEGNIANISATVTDQFIGLNSENRKTVPEGLFVAEVGNVVRFLPRAKVKVATSTSSPTVNMSPYNIFVPGDILHVNDPYVILTVTASAATQTQTITVSGRTATATVTTNNTTTSASEIALAINSAAYVQEIVYALSVNNLVYIFAKDGITNIPITEGGTVTATLSGAILATNATPIGTIQSINPITGDVTLSANSSVVLPVGTGIGVHINKILGLHVHSVDFDIATAKDLALYTQAAGVRIQYLPYYDGLIKTVFPKMLFSDKF